MSLPPGTLRENAMADVVEQAVAWQREGIGVALATVVQTWGSSPCPAGSLLAVTEDGRFEGSVSSGCVEGAVIETAAAVIADGRHQLLDFGVTDEMAWEVGLACGGQLQVLVERIANSTGQLDAGGEWLEELAEIRRQKRPAVVTVELGSGVRRLLEAGSHDPSASSDSSEDQLAEAARTALRDDRCALLDRGDERVLVQPWNPPLRLIIVGAVHIAQPLARMSRDAGYHVTVVDPRSAFASEERFPEIALDLRWPDEALEAFGIDARTAVVTLTHDPKLDDPALCIALKSDAFYVGCLGSRRTQAKRVERLEAEGLSSDEIARIHGPVGLAIGARSPAEIALSILAEITATLRTRSSRSDPA